RLIRVDVHDHEVEHFLTKALPALASVFGEAIVDRPQGGDDDDEDGRPSVALSETSERQRESGGDDPTERNAGVDEIREDARAEGRFGVAPLDDNARCRR